MKICFPQDVYVLHVLSHQIDTKYHYKIANKYKSWIGWDFNFLLIEIYLICKDRTNSAVENYGER